MTTTWDGRPATSEQLEFLGLSSYGSYTFLQVRRKAVRGLGLHLERLRRDGEELFGASPDPDRLRQLMAAAVTDQPCSLRVTLVSQDLDAVLAGAPVMPEVVVTTSEAREPSTTPISVRTAGYQRETPRVKHRATYGLVRHTRAARAGGFDDALFVDPQGRASEGTTWNLLTYDNGTWVWPEAEVLNGITMQLLNSAMSRAGISQDRRPVRPEDVAVGFTLNASSHARPLRAIDRRELTVEAQAAVQLEELWRSIEPEPL